MKGFERQDQMKAFQIDLQDDLIQISDDEQKLYLETASGISDNNIDENDNIGAADNLMIEEEKKSLFHVQSKP